jgi:hypothetical protein
MTPVGSANVYLLPVLMSAGWLLLFQPHLLAGLHFSAPFFAAPKVKRRAASFFQIQEMHHGKEVVLWKLGL